MKDVIGRKERKNISDVGNMERKKGKNECKNKTERKLRQKIDKRKTKECRKNEPRFE